MAESKSLNQILKDINKKFGTVRSDGTVEPLLSLIQF